MIANPLQPAPGVLDISPYVPGDERSSHARVFKLSSNETPLGPSRKAVEAFRSAADALHLYPDGSAAVLRRAIGAAHGLDPDRIVCGAGSDELLHLLAQGYLSPGEEAIFTEHGFLVYRIAILAAGATPVVAPERDDTADVDAILERVTPRTRMIFLANPNNPTGTYLPFAEVKRLHAGLPGGALLVLDGAYAEYVRRNDYSSGLELAAEAGNVVMTRTFSKIFGLASLRIGWCYGPAHVIDVLNRIRGPFNLTGPAIAAGAAAVSDRAHLEAAVAHNAHWLDRLSRDVAQLGLRVTPSVGNFLLIHFPDLPGRDAAAADGFLRDRGLVLRRVSSYGYPNALRMTVGSEEANTTFLAALRDFLADLAMTERIGRLALLGIGLIGSSIARGARAGGLADEIIVQSRSAATVAEAERLGLGDRYTTEPEDAVRDADLVILSIPVGACGAMAARIAPALKPGAIVSDVGSVKGSVVRQMQPALPAHAHFVPAHPVAGTEYSGPGAGFADLFKRRWCILTPPEGTDAEAVARVQRFWEGLGSDVEIMAPDHHDLVLAITSHVPHLIAYNIVGTAADLEEVTESEVMKFSAGGFRDFTRIAASDPTMWRDVFLYNKDAVLEMLGRFNEDLAALQRAIRWGDGEALFDLFTRTRAIRRGIIEAGQETAAPDFGRPHSS